MITPAELNAAIARCEAEHDRRVLDPDAEYGNQPLAVATALRWVRGDDLDLLADGVVTYLAT